MNKATKQLADDTELALLAKMSFVDWWSCYGNILRVLPAADVAWAAFHGGYRDGRGDGLTIAGALDITLAADEGGQ